MLNLLKCKKGGIIMSMFCFQCEQRGKYKGADGTLLDGCTVCGVWMKQL